MSRRVVESSGPRVHRLSLRKKLVFSLLTTLLFFGALEGALALLGVRPILATRDPFVGFAANIPLYVERRRPDGRVWMTTAPNKLEYFNAQRFPKAKPAGTFRIFSMGGSSTYGRPYDDTTSPAGWLRELLPALAPDTTWEVINAGGISYASYRVAALMEELLQYDPDLFIVYTGQNEFLEQRTYGDMRAASPARLRVSAVLGRTRTFSLLHSLLKPTQRSDGSRYQFPGEVDAVLDHTVGPSSYHRDDELRARILKHFEVNLTRMVSIARSRDAKILFIAPASNLKDCAPFKSQHSDGLDSSELERWSEFYERGKTLEEGGDLDESLAAYRQAEQIDDRFAQLHYRIGRVLFDRNRRAEAAVAFQRALDEDVCPLRAVSEMRKIFPQTAKRLSVPLIDFETLLKNECLRNYGHNSLGREFFLDHVHPTIAANRMLAVAVAQRLIREKIIDSDVSWADVDLKRITERIESRIDPRAHAVALRNLAKVLNWAGKHYEAGPLALRALETLPDDPESLFLAAAYLKMTGKTDRAIEYYRKTLRHSPDYAEAHQLLGAALLERKEFEEARKHFAEVLRIHPDDAHAHHMVGAILAELKRFEEALVYYREAVRLKPKDANIHYNLAFALAKLGKRTQAISHYTQTIRLNPDDADAHNNLGLLLVEEGQFADAVSHYRQALRIRPGDADAQQNLRIALEAQRQRPTSPRAGSSAP